MSAAATPDDIRQALLERSEIALLDLRPEAPFAAGHPLFAASLPIDRLELEAFTRIPRKRTPIVVYGSDSEASEFGAARLRRLGYSDVRTLRGGLAGWQDAGYEVFSDVNAPSKAFGELVAHELDTPFIEPQELLRQINQAAAVTVLDGRRFDEYQTMSVPTAVSAPNATLVRHVASLAEGDDLVVVNCAGRTRSIIGAQTLVHTALRPRVAALRNGTIGWTLAGQALEHGRDRRAQGVVTERAIAAAQGFADRAGVTRSSSDEIAALDPDARTIYRFDVRSPEAFVQAHLPGFLSAPGGQLIQETDYYAPVRGAKIVLADDDSTEANVTAAWLAQMGWDVAVLDGVRAADGSEHGPRPPLVPPLPEISWLSVAELARERQQDRPVTIIDLDTHRAYTSGHIPGALWGSRSDLLADVPSGLPRAETYVLTAEAEVLIAFSVADLEGRLPGRVVGLSGGTRGWADAGLPLSADAGMTLSAPRDRYRRPYEGTDVSERAMRAYLEWEYGLVDQLSRDGTHHFRPLHPARAAG
jgi:rhodanese-related sulfurtransferase